MAARICPFLCAFVYDANPSMVIGFVPRLGAIGSCMVMPFAAGPSASNRGMKMSPGREPSGADFSFLLVYPAFCATTRNAS